MLVPRRCSRLTAKTLVRTSDNFSVVRHTRYILICRENNLSVKDRCSFVQKHKFPAIVHPTEHISFASSSLPSYSSIIWILPPHGPQIQPSNGLGCVKRLQLSLLLRYMRRTAQHACIQADAVAGGFSRCSRLCVTRTCFCAAWTLRSLPIPPCLVPQRTTPYFVQYSNMFTRPWSVVCGDE